MSREIVIDLASRYAAAFGLLAVNDLSAALLKKQENSKKDYSIELYPKDTSKFDETTLSYKGESLRFGGMIQKKAEVFAPPLLIDFSRSKQLVETKVNGTDNIVIERWGTAPWTVEMRGILVDVDNHHYPADSIEQLCDFFEINDIIEVEGVQFDDKKIDSLYFKDIKINPVEGFQDTIQINLSASSIRPVEFNIFKA